MRKASLAGLVVVIALSGAVLFRPSTPTHHKVTLRWHPPAPVKGIRVVGYNVYRGTKMGGPYVKIATRVPDVNYVDNDVDSKTAYFYVVTALGNSGAESRYSNEVIVNVP